MIELLLGVYYLGGAFQGKVFLDLIDGYLKKLYDCNEPITFADLPIECKIVASDISNEKLIVLPDDLENIYGWDGKYGRKSAKDFPLAEAVRASMSLPLIFEPVYVPMYDNNSSNADIIGYATLVDGGLLSNFPVEQFADSDLENIPILGFWLGRDSEPLQVFDTSTVSGYLFGMFTSLQEAHDNYVLRTNKSNISVIPIPLDIRMTKGEQEQYNYQWYMKYEALKNQLENLEEGLSQIEKEIQRLESSRNDLERKVALNARDRYQRQYNKCQIEMEEHEQVRNSTTRLCSTLDFNLNQEQKDDLILNGRIATKARLDDILLAKKSLV